jgi:asparagine synthase (glutamine-hydrolysing)
MSGSAPWAAIAEQHRAARIPKVADPLLRASRMDFDNYLPEDILVKVDRASMLHSLEVRSPFLDHRLIEFAFGRVPSRLKASSSRRKILLKRLCTRVLPREFNLQRKQGFSIPLADWLRRDPWRAFFNETLLHHADSAFDKTFVRHLLDGHMRGRDNSERLFALVMFEMWRRRYGVSMV